MSAKLDFVKPIWSASPHNAFTSLTRAGSKWLCAFREGNTHVSPDGRIRVIISEGPSEWHPCAVLVSPYPELPDLRDPKITQTKEGDFRLIACARNFQEPADFQSLQWSSPDGIAWEGPSPAASPGKWLWGLTAGPEQLFATAYDNEDTKTDSESGVHLYTAGDNAFEFVSTIRSDDNYPGETAVSVTGQDALALCRRNRILASTAVGSSAPTRSTALLGTSVPPFAKWKWMDTGVHIGGPALIRLPNSRVIAAGRKLVPQPHTSLWDIDVNSGTLTELITLPSANDTGYPGLVYHGSQLWVSYYSSHEGRSIIYLARISLL